MNKNTAKNKRYLDAHGLEHIYITLPRETKRVFKSKLSEEGENITGFLLKCIFKYVRKKTNPNR